MRTSYQPTDHCVTFGCRLRRVGHITRAGQTYIVERCLNCPSLTERLPRPGERLPKANLDDQRGATP